MLTYDHIRNCPISAQDAKNIERIYGMDEGAIKGKMVRSTPISIDTDIMYQPPSDFIKKFKEVVLAPEDNG